MKENNKLIAEFMGLKPSPEDSEVCRVPDYSGKYILNPALQGRNYSEWATRYTDEDYNTGYELDYHQLEYNYSWDWLMPVVEKIENLKKYIHSIDVQICVDRITILVNATPLYFDMRQFSKLTKINSVYNAVIEFIKWYNQQNAG